MADKAHKLTDEKLEVMERHLSAIYSSKSREIQKNINEYVKSIEKKAKTLLKAVQEAQTEEEKRKAKFEYVRFFKKEVVKSEKFKKISKNITNELYLTNLQATNYVNSKLGQIYALNYNSLGEELSRDLVGYEFTDITAQEANDYGEMEKQEISKSKDNKWNEKNIEKSIIAGSLILLGTDAIFKRMVKNVTKKNLDSSRLHARGVATYAENKGSLDGMFRASDLGYEIEKQWRATRDNRTRDSHAVLDGETIPLDEKFSNGLTQPREPDGELAEICNCRCYLKYVLPQNRALQGSMTARRGEVTDSYKETKSFKDTETINIQNMNYKEWMEWRKKNGRN